MPEDMTDKKNKTISVRVSETQLDMMEFIKAENPRLSNTDMLMAGVNLLNYLLKNRKDGDRSYEELVNSLIIHDDLMRCIAKPDNPQIDNVKNKRELNMSLKENEEKIAMFLNILVK